MFYKVEFLQDVLILHPSCQLSDVGITAIFLFLLEKEAQGTTIICSRKKFY